YFKYNQQHKLCMVKLASILRELVMRWRGKIYACSGTVIRGETKLCALWNLLCVGRRSYTHSERFMRGETKLYALRTIYAWGNKVISAQNDLCGGKQSYTHSERFMRGESKYVLQHIALIYQY